MAKTKDNHTIRNKRATFDYELGDHFTAGIVLSGAETRSLRENHGSLQGAFVQVKDDEVWLINALITPLKSNKADLPSDKQLQNRKLLLQRKEIEKIIEAKKQGQTVVPIKILNRGKYIKVEIAIGRGKRKYDKRQAIKKREQARQISRDTLN